MARQHSASSSTRARVSTGKRARTSPFALTDAGDGRSVWATRFRTLIAQRLRDLGNDLSAQQHSLVRRSVMLEISLERLEAETASGVPVSISDYAHASGTLLRILRALGLKKQTATKRTPSLANWQRGEAASDAASSDEESR
jgi:hypothetical protein